MSKIKLFAWMGLLQVFFGQMFRALPGAARCARASALGGTWLVEWFHRRVIGSAGAFARRIQLVQCGTFRPLDNVLCLKQWNNSTIWNHAGAICLNYIFWKHPPPTLQHNKNIRYNAPVLHATTFRCFLWTNYLLLWSWNIRNICSEGPSPSTLAYVSRSAGGRSLRASVPFSRDMIPKVVAPKSNCISGGMCSTNRNCTMWNVPTFGWNFLCRKLWTSEMFWNLAAAMCLNLISWKYQPSTLRNKQVTRSHATVLNGIEISNLFGATIDVFGNVKNRNICLAAPFPSTLTYLSRPAGGRSLRASVPFGRDMVRRVFTPKNNRISGDICSTNWTCTILNFSACGWDFLCRKQWKSEMCWNHAAAICLNLISWKYQPPTLRNKKVIRSHATVLHDMTNSNLFCANIDLLVNVKNQNICLEWFLQALRHICRVLPGAARCARASPSVGTWFAEWLHRRVIASAGAFVRRIELVQCGTFRHLDEVCFVQNNGNRKCFEIMQQQFVWI